MIDHDRDGLIDELRSSWARGSSPSALLRELLTRGWVGARLIILMQDAFGLSLSSTNAITSWLSYRDDDRLDRFLIRWMPARVGRTAAPEDHDAE